MGEREMNTNIKGTPGNGINVGALREFADQVAAKPAAGIATFGVVTTWEGGHPDACANHAARPG